MNMTPTRPLPRLRLGRVLIVEDNVDGRESLSQLLQCWGYRVDTAGNGYEGVEKALMVQPQVALVDIGLPGIDGFGVAEQLRAAMGAKILLIAQTAYSSPEDRARGLAAGFDAWLVKPLDPEVLSHWLLVGAARSASHH